MTTTITQYWLDQSVKNSFIFIPKAQPGGIMLRHGKKKKGSRFNRFQTNQLRKK